MSRASILLFLFAIAAIGQTGEIQLEVKDPSGAAAEASGTLSRLSAGVVQNYQTDKQGRYTFSALSSGRYRLEIVAAGFASQAVLVDVAESPVVLTITLTVGSETTRVDVVAATPLPGVELLLEQIAAP